MPDEALPEGALDIQHDTDPEPDAGAARHIPHLGHVVLFFVLAAMSVFLCESTTALALHIRTAQEALSHPLALFLAQCGAYLMTLVASWFLFPLFWQRSFLRGISWTARAARRHWWQLISLGVFLSAVAQLSELLFHEAKQSEVTLLLHTRLSAWCLTLLGPTLAPLMEEVSFRGFLLPALATAYDWLSLERTPAGIAHWRESTSKTTSALVFGSVMSSIAFAILHGSQLHWAKGPVAVLFVISLAFSAVYVRFRSVAATTLVHVAYNGLIFVELFVESGGFRHLDKL